MNFIPIFVLLLFSELIIAQPKSAVDNAIEKGIKYLANKKGDIDPQALFILNYLHRKFNLPDSLSYKHMHQLPKTDAAQYDLNFKNIVKFNRLITSSYLIDSLAFQTYTVDSFKNAPYTVMEYVMLRAIHCDLLELPEKYFDLLDTLILSNDYFLTHAALSFIWLYQNRCLSSRIQDKYRKKIEFNLFKLINDKNKKNLIDLRIEAIVMYQFVAGRKACRFEKRQLQWIIKKQENDGGWCYFNNKYKVTSDHSTVLAVWALLEFKFRKHKIEQNMIVK